MLVKANNGYLFVKSYILTFVYISQVFLFTYLYKAKTFAMRIEIYTKSTEMPELINGPVLHSAMAFRTFEHNSKDKPYMLVAYDSNGEEAGSTAMLLTAGFCSFR